MWHLFKGRTALTSPFDTRWQFRPFAFSFSFSLEPRELLSSRLLSPTFPDYLLPLLRRPISSKPPIFIEEFSISMRKMTTAERGSSKNAYFSATSELMAMWTAFLVELKSRVLTVSETVRIQVPDLTLVHWGFIQYRWWHGQDGDSRDIK
jgi:hypothetical protein